MPPRAQSFVGKGDTGSGLQISFKIQSLGSIGKRQIGFENPRAIFCGVGGFSGVVILEPLPEIFCEASVNLVGRGFATEEGDVEHGRAGGRMGVPFVAGKKRLIPSSALRATEGILRLLTSAKNGGRGGIAATCPSALRKAPPAVWKSAAARCSRTEVLIPPEESGRGGIRAQARLLTGNILAHFPLYSTEIRHYLGEFLTTVY